MTRAIEMKIAATMDSLRVAAQRQKRLDRYRTKLQRRLAALKVALDRAESPEGVAAAQARKDREAAAKAAVRERLFEVNLLARGFATKIGAVKTPIVRWTGSRGACKHARGGGHVHVRGKGRGIICLGSVWRAPGASSPEGERVLQRLLAYCVARLWKNSHHPVSHVEMGELLAAMLGKADGTAFLEGAWRISDVAASIGEDQGRR